MNPSMISVLSAMAAAIWSVWTWQSEQQKGRELKRNEMSAQYVNNLIMATQELQRKLFKILEENDLARYGPKYPQPVEPASPVAIELLFHFCAFFGWSNLTFRFGPYTRDPKMIAIMAQIGDVLDSGSRFTGDAFRFTLSDRHALGQAAVRRVAETSSGPAFLNITRFKFEEEMRDKGSELAGLFRSEEVRCTLRAIDRAISGEELEGHERLAVLQNRLLDLVSYLEQQEGFRVSYGERARAKVEEQNAAESSPPSGKDIIILHQMPGRIRLRFPYLHNNETLNLKSILKSLHYVKGVRVNIAAACVIIEYSPSVSQTKFIEDMLAMMEDASCEPAHQEVDHDAHLLVANQK